VYPRRSGRLRGALNTAGFEDLRMFALEMNSCGVFVGTILAAHSRSSSKVGISKRSLWVAAVACPRNLGDETTEGGRGLGKLPERMSTSTMGGRRH